MFAVWENGKHVKVKREKIKHLRDKVFKGEDTSDDEDVDNIMVYVKLHEALVTPLIDSGFLIQVKRAIKSREQPKPSPYVEVFFGGLKGVTSMQKQTTTPSFNELMTFTLKLPLPSDPLVVQVRCDTTKSVIGQAELHMDKISNSNSGGFLPTFGPAYVYLSEAKASQNSDTFCRGRLMMSLTSEIATIPKLQKPSCKVEEIAPTSESECGHEVEFLLFACIRSGTMIAKKHAGTPLRFSVQLDMIGNETSKYSSHHESCCSFMNAETTNKKLYYLQIKEKKECFWSNSLWPDYRRRMYFSNLLDKSFDEIDGCLQSLHHYADSARNPCVDIIVKQLEDSITYNLTLLKEDFIFSTKTQLDIERWKMLERILENVCDVAISYRQEDEPATVDVIMTKLKKSFRELKAVKDDPQPSLPDVVLWMENEQKRIGYSKIAARDLLYAPREEERGLFCGKIRSVFFKSLNKKESIPYLAKIEIFLWLGLQENFQLCLQSLPRGFDTHPDGKEISEIDYIPRVIHYYDTQIYRVHAHLHQARFLPWSNMAKFPCPAAQLYIGEKCLSTQIRYDTLNPEWGETLVFSDLVFYGCKSEIAQYSPDVTIEIFNCADSSRSVCMSSGVIQVSRNDYDNPPLLKWYKISTDKKDTTEILAAFELILVSQPRGDEYLPSAMPIPESIRPRLSTHRVEVLFWGLRNLKRLKLSHIKSLKIEVECNGIVIDSNIISGIERNSNFANMVEVIDVDLPEREEYFPSMTISLLDCKNFGHRKIVASHIISRLQKYVVKPNGILLEPKFSKQDSHHESTAGGNDTIIDIEPFDDDYSIKKLEMRIPWNLSEVFEKDVCTEEMDWWSRFYISSLEMPQRRKSSIDLLDQYNTNRRSTLGIPVTATLAMLQRNQPRKSIIPTFNKPIGGFSNECFRLAADNLNAQGFMIYPCELENVPEFGGFKEWLHSFELARGRTLSRFFGDTEKTVAIFKGCFRIYKHPLPTPMLDPLLPMSDNSQRLFGGLPENKPLKVLVRVYFVQALDLTALDLSNSTDPYIVIKCGQERLSDKENYMPNQLNPVFGKSFEFVANFPGDSLLTIQIMDKDFITADDLIGETKIDLENRFYSRHRATCGLPRTYDTSGPNSWRDGHTPTEILTTLCEKNGLHTPLISRKEIRIENIVYDFSNEDFEDDDTGKQNMALYLLHHWKKICPGEYSIVPEHLETRTLYHPSKPGESQGKLVMWVDMFPGDSIPSCPPSDISKRKPVGYELRVIIWNTDEVILADDAFFTGEKMSDIYVKGWLTGKEDAQRTDVHYRSLTGEGNFNWRFVFPFDYLPTERKMVVMKKRTLFSWDKTEYKLPPELKLQVFDADHFKSDDFLGDITLDLNKFPRGAKSAHSCSLKMLEECGSVPQVSLFKHGIIRGWWPVSIKTKDGLTKLTGKVDAELHLLTKEEAEKSPVGMGRKEPAALPAPKRPETSFLNFLHPFKTFRYAVWRRHKNTIFKIALLILLLLFLYAVPGYAAKRVLGA